MMRSRVNHVHMVGIGGSGMNGIAEVLINMGFHRHRLGHFPRDRPCAACSAWARTSSSDTAQTTSRARTWWSNPRPFPRPTPRLPRGAGTLHPHHSPRRNAGRADAPAVGHRRGRDPRQDHHDLAAGHRVHRGWARSHRDHRRSVEHLRRQCTARRRRISHCRGRRIGRLLPAAGSGHLHRDQRGQGPYGPLRGPGGHRRFLCRVHERHPLLRHERCLRRRPRRAASAAARQTPLPDLLAWAPKTVCAPKSSARACARYSTSSWTTNSGARSTFPIRATTTSSTPWARSV